MKNYKSNVLVALLCQLTVAAQDTPKLEVFGGYSHLGLANQSRLLLEPARLNGWNGSAKLNVTARIGLVADLSGHYGQRTFTPYTISSVITPGAVTQVEGKPGDLRQHTFLFGPELRLYNRDRLTVNVRALMGVAHTNTLVTPLREPIQRSPDLFGNPRPPITQRSFAGATTFAASFGGALDYRITDRLSYRILQPEILMTRGPWNQFNFRLSTGIVFTSGVSSSGHSSSPQFSFGVIGGAALTDAFAHESTGFMIGLSGGLEPVRSRSYSTLKDYVIGPTLDIRLPWRSTSVEIDALYRPLNLTMAGVRADGSLHSISPATVVTWEFPVLAKYRFTSNARAPFIEVGPSFRASGNLNNASPSAYGGTVGLGAEAVIGKLKLGPLVRYTHWGADPDFAGSRSRRNQVELLFGLSF